MKKQKNQLSNNVFKGVVREVVREEFQPVEKRLNEKLEIKFETHKEDILQGTKDLLTDFKSDFATMKDEIVGEIKAMREEFTIHQGQHDEITERLDKLGAIHPQGRHTS